MTSAFNTGLAKPLEEATAIVGTDRIRNQHVPKGIQVLLGQLENRIDQDVLEKLQTNGHVEEMRKTIDQRFLALFDLLLRNQLG
jgi:hypothetical protein